MSFRSSLVRKFLAVASRHRLSLRMVRAIMGSKVASALENVAEKHPEGLEALLPPFSLLLEHPFFIRLANVTEDVPQPFRTKDYTKMTDEWDAIIVGAGTAGLAAAQRIQHGESTQYRVLVLEARDRIGGRVHTVEMGSPSESSSSEETDTATMAVDLGASFIHGASPLHEFVQMAEWTGTSTSPTPGGIWENPLLTNYSLHKQQQQQQQQEHPFASGSIVGLHSNESITWVEVARAEIVCRAVLELAAISASAATESSSQTSESGNVEHFEPRALPYILKAYENLEAAVASRDSRSRGHGEDIIVLPLLSKIEKQLFWKILQRSIGYVSCLDELAVAALHGFRPQGSHIEFGEIAAFGEEGMEKYERRLLSNNKEAVHTRALQLEKEFKSDADMRDNAFKARSGEAAGDNITSVIYASKCPPGDRFVQSGYRGLVIEPLSKGLHIALNHPVQAVKFVNDDYDREGKEGSHHHALHGQNPGRKVSVVCGNGRELKCRTLICTAPIGVLLPSISHHGPAHTNGRRSQRVGSSSSSSSSNSSSSNSSSSRKRERMSSSIQFDPPLSRRVKDALMCFGMGAHNKVVLKFNPDDVFWPLHVPQFNCVDLEDRELSQQEEEGEQTSKRANVCDGKGEDGKKNPFNLRCIQWQNLHAYGVDGVIVTHLWPPLAREIDQMSDEEVVAKIMEILHRSFLQPKPSSPQGGGEEEEAKSSRSSCKGLHLPQPESYVVTRWQEEEFSQGSYSFLAPIQPESTVRSHSEAVDVLMQGCGPSPRNIWNNHQEKTEDDDEVAAVLSSISVNDDEQPGCNSSFGSREEDNEDTLFFAGEAITHRSPQCVYGAFLSGLRAGTKAVDALSRNNDSSCSS
eukprot:jgi/Bigna1/69266/fgenesh1_pg.8_\